MRITPLDIRKQEFHKAMRGLDSEEVYAFLSTVGDEYETLLNDNKALRERVLELDDKVQEYRTMEKTLRDTLLTAERVTVEAKDNARREANLIIKEAQIEAEKALRDIKNESMRLHHEVQQLRQQRDGFLARMKVITESHLKYIEMAERDNIEDDQVAQVQAPGIEPAENNAQAEPEETKPNLFTPPADVPDDQSAAPDATETEPESRGDLPAATASTVTESAPAMPASAAGLGRTPVGTESTKTDDAPSVAPAQIPTPITDQSAEPPPGPTGGASTLSDINDILDRMADGNVVTPSTPEPPALPASPAFPQDDQTASQFEPIPDPPVEEEDRVITPHASHEDTPSAPAPGSDIPVGRAWDYVSADKTGCPQATDPAEAEAATETEPAEAEAAYDPLSALDDDPDRR